jgi:hypothetical protein
MKRGRKSTVTNLPKEIDEACKEIIAQGKRPTGRSVREYLVAKHGAATSYTHIGPLVRAWKSNRSDTDAVMRVCRAYNALDPVQKKAVRDRLGLLRAPSYV